MRGCHSSPYHAHIFCRLCYIASPVRAASTSALEYPCFVSPFDVKFLAKFYESKSRTESHYIWWFGLWVFNSLFQLLFHGLGASQHALASETTAEVTDALMQLNAVGPIKLTRAMLPHMLRRNRGRLVVVGSMSCKLPSPGQVRRIRAIFA